MVISVARAQGLVLFLPTLFSAACSPSPVNINPDIADIRLAAGEMTILRGDTVRLVGVPVDKHGEPVANVGVAWHGSDSTVVIVDATGLVYGVARGSGIVEAAALSIHREVTIQVQESTGGWSSLDVGCGTWNDGSTFCWSLAEGPVGLPVRLPGPDLDMVRYGQHHFCGLTAAGDAYCWGVNDFGELGDGSTISRGVPTRVAGGIQFDSIAVGAIHTCGLTQMAEIYCWGADARGQLGIGGAADLCGVVRCSTVPRKVQGAYKAIALGGTERTGIGSSGRGLTCAVTMQSDVKCWGYNALGGVGDGTRTDRNVPMRVLLGDRARAIAVGHAHACALLADGSLACWGGNNYGQLGLTLPEIAKNFCEQGDAASACAVDPVAVPSNEQFRSVVASDNVTCALNLFGAALCWGDNAFGQVGDGTFSIRRAEPTRVLDSRTFLSVRLGLSTACGLTPNRVGICWGNGMAVPAPLPDPPTVSR